MVIPDDVKPWVVIVVRPESRKEVKFFDDYLHAWKFAEERPNLTCVVGTAIAVSGPVNGMGIHHAVKT